MLINNIYQTAKLCRAFELCAYGHCEKGNIDIPIYLSAGQETIPATLSQICKEKNIAPLIFGQHRGHSIYLSFGGNPIKLIDELLGKETGCAKGMGGSASIHDPSINMYGHDGLMGSNVPIGVGACFASQKPTIVFVGDGAAEEDYALAAYGWASTKNLPILFVVEDNGLSILTEKKVRRNWKISDVGKAMKLDSQYIDDAPKNILHSCGNIFEHPMMLNIVTNRKFWHAGAGTDGKVFDRLDGLNIEKELEYMESLWQSRLETK